jgi:hypothetical protein
VNNVLSKSKAILKLSENTTPSLWKAQNQFLILVSAIFLLLSAYFTDFNASGVDQDYAPIQPIHYS